MSAELRRFSIRLAAFSVPFVAVLASFAILDPFQVVHPGRLFYTESHVEPNRDFASTEIYLRSREAYSYDSFIFGSSRSRAFESKDWRRYEPDARPFHFDASAETLFGISAKLNLIDSSGGELVRALIVLDQSTLSTVADSEGHLFIKHPRASRGSWTNFYLMFVSDYFSHLFFVKFLDYKLFGSYRQYMKDAILRDPLRADPVSNDLYLCSQDEVLSRQESGSQERFGFYARGETLRHGESVVGPPQLVLLQNIKKILDKHRTRYKIIVSPLYDQVFLNKTDVGELRTVFGENKVWDFSGVNELTEDPSNYCDSSHYTPVVARELLSRIYAYETTE